MTSQLGLVTLVEVFVDDFIAATNNKNLGHITHVSHSMLHGVHKISPPTSITGHNGADPISEGKLDKGEGTWNTLKEILGWEINGIDYTINLPITKVIVITKMIKKLLKAERTSLQKFQKLAGKLQHASYGMPGGVGLFSPIQMAMKGNPNFIILTPELKHILDDWRFMIRLMESSPTSVLQLVTNYPDYVGYSDACGIGVGGCWTSGLKHLYPFLWQYEWPPDIKASLITEHNPDGSLTINDLELAGAVINFMVLESQNINLKFHHIGTFCDNTSAVSWAYRLRNSTSRIAGRLLRVLSLRIHAKQASSLVPLNIAGEENVMADVVSRAFKSGKFFHASGNLTNYFDAHFPLPQKQFWQEYQLPKKLISLVIASLRGELLPMELLLKQVKHNKNIGNCGVTMPPNAELTPSSATSHHWNETQSSAHLLGGSGQASSVAELKSKFRASRMHSRPSPRPSNWLDNEVPYTGRRKNTT